MTADPDDLLESDQQDPAPESQSLLMTVREVCGLFSKTRRTIENWARQDLLHKVRVGGSVFFRRSEVVALIEERNAP